MSEAVPEATTEDRDPDGGLVIQRRDLTHLPIDQRRHQQIHPQWLKIEQMGFSTGGRPISWSDRVDIYTGAFSCHLCDAYPGYRAVVDADGEPVSLRAATECPLPEGVEMVNDLDVPSGRLVVSDDLRPIYDIPLTYDIDVPDYNSLAGQALHSRKMFEIGCAYGPVLNSSPTLLRTDEDRYVIASLDHEAGPGEDGYLEGERLASICTDLWAYSIADYDHWLARARPWVAARGQRDLAQNAADADEDGDRYDRLGLAEWLASGADPADLPWTVTVVDVPAGTYRFTHHTSKASFDHDRPSPVVFADIVRVD